MSETADGSSDGPWDMELASNAPDEGAKRSMEELLGQCRVPETR